MGQQLDRALTSFDKVVGDAELARHISHHFNEYLRDEGDPKGKPILLIDAGVQFGFDATALAAGGQLMPRRWSHL